MEQLSKVLTLAADQHGAVSLAQLDALDVPRRARLAAVRSGWLVAAARGVYVVAGSVDSVERRLHVGLLQLGAAAVVSHEGAARLHHFDRCRPDAVEFTVRRAKRSAGHGLVVHTNGAFGPTDRVRVGGFPCTSATRTIIDLARARVGRGRLEAAIDSAVRTGASSPLVLAERLAALRGPGHWGAPLIDSLLPDSGGHSSLERRFLAVVRPAGLPRPATQVVHRRGSRTIARADFLFDESGLVVEVSGRLGHASDAERAKDGQRRNELQAHGRRVYEFTNEQVRRRPASVIADLREALSSASVLDARDET